MTYGLFAAFTQSSTAQLVASPCRSLSRSPLVLLTKKRPPVQHPSSHGAREIQSVWKRTSLFRSSFLNARIIEDAEQQKTGREKGRKRERERERERERGRDRERRKVRESVREREKIEGECEREGERQRK